MTNEKAIERIKAFSIFLTGGNPIWDVDECKEAFDIALAAMSERNPDEWCDSCKEYDHSKNCCPRFNRVIRETVEEVKRNAEQKWIPCKERLPEPYSGACLTCDKDGCVTILCYDAPGDGIHFESVFYEWEDEYWCRIHDDIVAWMPLPMPWRGEEDK